jgi:signal transduction histidine kinase
MENPRLGEDYDYDVSAMPQDEGLINPASVLIVDDEVGPREAIRLVLEPHFRVTTAESGEQALDLLRRQQVEVVTLDLMIPGLGGIEAFRKIRELDSDVQIIIVSGGSHNDLAHTLPHTASAWISKPFEMHTLVEAVERAAEETRRGRRRAVKSVGCTVGELAAPALEGLDEPKKDVAKTFSQDIKDRLHSILGFVRLLRKGQLDSRRAEEALDVIENNAHEALSLTVNFLHAEESDGGSLQLHKTPASLNQIVQRVMEGEAPWARSKRIEFEHDLDSAIPSVDLDVAMISHAVTNLLDSAIHYSLPEGGIVRVETRHFADVMILRVRHQGRVVAAEEVPELFQQYGSGETSAGLGLYLVRTIVEAHGGSVSATFPPDGGSGFVVVLPSAPCDA